MDTTNVNFGEKNELKRYLEHKVPLLKWIGYNNHKLALTFKHLISSFQWVVEIDIFLLNLWKAMNILGNTSEIHGVFPRVTWWQAHERACEIFHLYFENFLDAFSTPYAKQKGSWSTRAVYSRLILSNHCNKFDALWCFQIYKTVNFIFSNNYIFTRHPVCTHPPPFLLGGVEPPAKFSKRIEGLDRTLNLRGGCWKRGR